MKTFTLIFFGLMIGIISSVNANETPKPDEFEKKYGSICRISDEAGAKLKEPIEIKLHAIKLPEVVFAQANLPDVVDFLNNASTSFDKKKDDKAIAVALEKGISETDLPLITFACKNVSILEVIKFITTVTDLKYKVEKGSVILTRANKSIPSIPSAQKTSEPQIKSRTLAIVLFPINVLPDILSNALVSIFSPGSVENQFGPPCTIILAPLNGPYYGIKDAWQGYLFYDPAILERTRW